MVVAATRAVAARAAVTSTGAGETEADTLAAMVVAAVAHEAEETVVESKSEEAVAEDLARNGTVGIPATAAEVPVRVATTGRIPCRRSTRRRFDPAAATTPIRAAHVAMAMCRTGIAVRDSTPAPASAAWGPEGLRGPAPRRAARAARDLMAFRAFTSADRMSTPPLRPETSADPSPQVRSEPVRSNPPAPRRSTAAASCVGSLPRQRAHRSAAAELATTLARRIRSLTRRILESRSASAHSSPDTTPRFRIRYRNSRAA